MVGSDDLKGLFNLNDPMILYMHVYIYNVHAGRYTHMDETRKKTNQTHLSL